MASNHTWMLFSSNWVLENVSFLVTEMVRHHLVSGTFKPSGAVTNRSLTALGSLQSFHC